jgi:hypothetical protein
MVLLISLLLVAQVNIAPLWAPSDILIGDSLGPYVDFAADYNYSNGNIYVACIPDSGTYFGPDSMGILLFRSDNHGETWDMIFREAYQAQYWELKDIDLVVTRNDTVYVLMSWYHEVPENDQLNVAKIFREVGVWSINWLLSSAINATEIRSPKIVRDDFDDFYLYIAYLDITPDRDSLIILRSTDRGYNWNNLLRASSVSNWQEQDIAVADSSLYHLSILQNVNNQTLQLSYWRGRGNGACKVKNPLWVNTYPAEQIQYPRIGVTTTLPDSTQLVYLFYSQRNSGLGDYDLLYLYSEEGGDDWSNSSPSPGTVNPDTLLKGSSSRVLCDIRGYQAEPNEYMNITYCFTSSSPSPNFENFWSWSSESDPTNWQGTATVGTGTYRSIPELVYSPGAPGNGEAVIYNDSLGNLWLDAPRLSGIPENLEGKKDKIRSQIVLAGSSVETGSSGAVVYDATGREIITLDANYWDLKDGKGEEVKGGIYFIVNKENGNRIKISILK